MTIPIAVPNTVGVIGAGSAVPFAKSINRTFVLGPGAIGVDSVALMCSTDNGVSYQQAVAKGSNNPIRLTVTSPEVVIDDNSDHYAFKRTALQGGSTLSSVSLEVESSLPVNPGQLATLTLADFPVSGTIGSAATTVDGYNSFLFSQATPNVSLTPPNPTDTSPTKAPYYFQNPATSVTLTFLGRLMPPGTTLEAAWNGSAWVPISASVSTGILSVVGSLDAAAETDVMAGNAGLNLTTVSGGFVTLTGDLAGTGGIQALTGTGGFALNSLTSISLTPGLGSAIQVLPRAGAGNTGAIAFFELTANGSNFVGFKAPDSLAGDTTYILPVAFPARNNEHLTSTTAGALSWRGAIDVQASNTNAQSIADGAAAAIVTTWTSSVDTASALNAGTGVFTAPVTGFYWVSAAIEYAASVSALNAEFSVQVFVNGAVVAIGANQSQVSAGSVRHTARVTTGVQVTAGQTIDIRAAQNGGAGAVLLTNVAAKNTMSISLVS